MLRFFLRLNCICVALVLWACATTVSEKPTSSTTLSKAQPSRDLTITFVSGPLTLEGTLSLPMSREGHRHPAVVLGHGSGPQSRGAALPGQLGLGFGFTLPVFEQLTSALVKEGYVVLRFDKRTCFSGNGCTNHYPTPDPNVSPYDFIKDIQASLRFLEQHEKVDPDNLFVVGHSQGATFVPKLLADNPALRAGVMLAGNYRSMDAIMAYQADKIATLMAESGAPQKIIAQQVAPIRDIVTKLQAIRDGTYSGGPFGGASKGFWADLLVLGDEAPALVAALEQPLLVIGGGYDWNVPASEAILWQNVFSGNPEASSHQMKIFECVSHALNCISQPNYRAITPTDIEETIYRPLLDTLTVFLRESQSTKP